MGRKTLFSLLAVLCGMVAVVAALLALLYGGPSSSKKSEAFDLSDADALYCCVPSNAVALARFPSLEEAIGSVCAGHPALGKALSDAKERGELTELLSEPLAVSFHYVKSIVPLYILDAGDSDDASFDADIQTLKNIASSAGLHFEECDCSKIIGVAPRLKGRRVLLASSSESIVDSALRHIETVSSIYDSNGFPEAASRLSSRGQFLLNAADADKLLPVILAGSTYRPYLKTLSTFCGWAGFEADYSDGDFSISALVSSRTRTDCVNMLSSVKNSSCEAFRAAPSSTVFLLSLPIKSSSASLEAFDGWLEMNMRLSDVKAQRKQVSSSCGISPAEWLSKLEVVEIAHLSFSKGSKTFAVNLLKGSKIKGADSLSAFPAPGCLASLFGKQFTLEDESFCAVKGGWMVSGSREGVENYLGAMEYSLSEKLSNADLKGEIPSSGVLAAYFSIDSGLNQDPAILSQSALKTLRDDAAGVDMMPCFLTISSEKEDGCLVEFRVKKAELKKTKAPTGAQEDVEVKIPQGPFTVKNCATGKNNTLVQNANLSISLRDDKGKGVWTVPFSGKICGSVCNVDYFANGKIQFLFASGSKIYLLDRLGHFVSPFPVDLGKKIVLGPAAYDFSGAKKYNILTLFEDNSIGMFNLAGKVPDGWKGICPKDKIVSLPERIDAGGKTLWVVRTSRETLIYPFGGGESLTSFSGNDMLRPDTEVKVLDSQTLSATSYNGKTQKIRLK